MKASLVIRTKDEADRLRLTLASVARQTVAPEVVVVDDGSSDHTGSVLAEAGERGCPSASSGNERAQGRCAASNAGAGAATGDILNCLDGDTLLGPDCVERHLAAHATNRRLAGRGETWHLRATRFLLDPETGTPRPGEEARLARMPAAELERLKVTRAQVEGDFAAIERRAEAGVYPGAGPRRLYELETEALAGDPDCAVLWAASVVVATVLGPARGVRRGWRVRSGAGQQRAPRVGAAPDPGRRADGVCCRGEDLSPDPSQRLARPAGGVRLGSGVLAAPSDRGGQAAVGVLGQSGGRLGRARGGADHLAGGAGPGGAGRRRQVGLRRRRAAADPGAAGPVGRHGATAQS